MKLVSGLSGQWDSSICCRASREDSGGRGRLWSWPWHSGWQPFCWWRRQGTQPSTGPLQPSAPPEGSPGTSCPGISASRRSAQPSGAEPAGLVWSAAKGKRLRCPCGTGPRDQPITPPHLETFVHILLFPDGIFMREQERPNKISASDKFTAVIPCEKCA